MKNLKSFSIAAAASMLAVVGIGCAPAEPPETMVEAPPPLSSDVVTSDEQQAMTPDMVLADLKAGNERFVAGKLTPRDYLAQASATASGQYPKAAILSCVDSRVPPEIIFDQGIGDVFVGRVAGNFENIDMLGSFEFATKAAGAKVIVVLGHSSCGAIKGALNGVELGNLTEMLANFDGPVSEAREAILGPDDASNSELVEAAVEENVRQTMADILKDSPVIAEMVANGEVAVVGGIYDLASGRVTWLDS